MCVAFNGSSQFDTLTLSSLSLSSLTLSSLTLSSLSLSIGESKESSLWLGELLESLFGSHEPELRDSSLSGSESFEVEWVVTFLKKNRMIKTSFTDCAVNSGDLNTGLVWNSNGQKFIDRRMVSFSDNHLNTGQTKVFYSDVSVIQIPTVFDSP